MLRAKEDKVLTKVKFTLDVFVEIVNDNEIMVFDCKDISKTISPSEHYSFIKLSLLSDGVRKKVLKKIKNTIVTIVDGKEYVYDGKNYKLKDKMINSLKKKRVKGKV